MSSEIYPIRVEASRDPQLSRWLWLVKWFLAIPHCVALVFLWLAFVLLSIAAFFAILFTGRYPRAIFDFNVGVLRWTWRVQYYTYGALGTDRYPPFSLKELPDYPARLAIDYPEQLSRLMTDRYPPFRLDMGGAEPGGRFSVPPPGPGTSPGTAATLAPEGAGPAVQQAGPGRGPQPPPLPPPRPAAAAGWTGGRIVSVVIGSVLALASAGLLTGGAGVLWAQTQRQDGYLTSAPRTYSTHGYALATESIGLHAGGWDWVGQVLGKVRIRVTWPGTAKPLFLGIAPTAAATGYLFGVPYTTVTDLGGNAATISHLGTATPRAPQLARIWSAQVSGPGTQALTWTAREGDWMVVVMNRDGGPGLTVRADAGVTVPALPWIAAGLLAGGVLLAAAGVLLIVLPVHRASAHPGHA